MAKHPRRDRKPRGKARPDVHVTVQLAIRSSSPMAEGVTVNIRPAGDGFHLRVWILGAPVEDSMHATATEALTRVGMIVMTRMGLGGLLG